MRQRVKTIVLLLLACTLGAAALSLLKKSDDAVYVINEQRYEIPYEYLGPFARSGLSTRNEIDGYDPEGPIAVVFFSGSELKEEFPHYVLKYGEESFNTTFSVMIFTSDREGTFEDEFLAFLPASSDGVDVQYSMEQGLYFFKQEENPYALFAATGNPYISGFDRLDDDIFIRCSVWPNDHPDGRNCRYFLKVKDTFFGFYISSANLNLSNELTDYFFTKLDSWRVED